MRAIVARMAARGDSDREFQRVLVASEDINTFSV